LIFAARRGAPPIAGQEKNSKIDKSTLAGCRALT
jgi:hypothetical protein